MICIIYHRGENMQTKKCGTCKKVKSVDDFTKNSVKKDGLSTQCKECKKVYQDNWYKSNKKIHIKNTKAGRLKSRKAARQFLNEFLLDKKCVDCGETNPIVLQFDHVKGNKIDAVSKLVTAGYSVDFIKAEIEKCEVRCANCHMKKTYTQLNWKSKSHR